MKDASFLDWASHFLVAGVVGSWWVAFLVEGRLEDTIFANYVWTVFNTIVMLVFINMGASRKPK